MATLPEYARTHTPLEVALLELTTLARYKAVEWHNGEKVVNALSWNGSGEPVVTHDPAYESYEAFEEFEKFLRSYVHAALAMIELAQLSKTEVI